MSKTSTAATPSGPPLALELRILTCLRANYEFHASADRQNAAANLADDVRERPLTVLNRELHDELLAIVTTDPAGPPE